MKQNITKSYSKQEEPETTDELSNAAKMGAGPNAPRPALRLTFSRKGISLPFYIFGKSKKERMIALERKHILEILKNQIAKGRVIVGK